MANRVEVTIDVDGDKARTELAAVNRHVIEFTNNTNSAGKSGSDLKTIFAGSVLADFFTRGSSAALQFADVAIKASAAAADSQRVLSSSATEAGLAYTDLSVKAEGFATRVGLSNAEAARTYAGLVQFANQAGQTDKLDLFTKKLSDLAAARGIASNQLGDLARQLGTLQDEATDKLFGANPSAFYGAFAASIGKTADALTDAEKRAAIFNAVIEKGSIFDGSAEERLASTAGQLDAANASFGNLTAGIGDAITQSVEFKGTLILIDDLLGNVASSAARAREELAKGLKTPEQLADEERNGGFRQAFNALKGAATFVPAVGAETGNLLALLTGQKSFGEYNTDSAGNFNAVFNPGQTQRDARVDQLRADKEELNKQQTAAGERAEIKKTDTAKEQAHTAQLKRVDAEKKALEELYNFQKSAIKDAQSATERLFGSLASQAAKDNPFVQFYSEAAESARDFQTTTDELQKRFGAAADSIIDRLAELSTQKLEGITEQALGTRFSDQLQAGRLLREADELRTNKVVDTRTKDFLAFADGQGITEQDKFNALLKRQAQGSYVGSFNGLLAGNGLRDETISVDPAAKSAKADIELVRRLTEEAIGGGVDKERAQRQADKQLLDITSRLSADVLSGDSGLKNTRIEALSREAGRVREREEEARRRQEQEDRSREETKKSLDELTASNKALEKALKDYKDGALTIKIDDKSSAQTSLDRQGAPTR